MMFKASSFMMMLAFSTFVASLALPLPSQAGLEEGKIVKRMENGAHARNCPCLRCFAANYDLPPITLPTAADFVTNRYLQCICYPMMKVGDCVLEKCEDCLNNARVTNLKDNYIKYLGRRGIDPNDVQVVYRNDGGASSSARRNRNAMSAPLQMGPMRD